VCPHPQGEARLTLRRTPSPPSRAQAGHKLDDPTTRSCTQQAHGAVVVYDVTE
jgi:hypothetical protein